MIHLELLADNSFIYTLLMSKFRIMFVCLGNICRSPLAHAVFMHMVRAEELDEFITVDSSGTGAWHVGEKSDPRMMQTAGSHGVHINHRSQQLNRDHLVEYDLLLTMDRNNYRETLALCRSDEERKKVRLFRDYDPEGAGDVPDPWYGGQDGFETVWTIVHRTSESLLKTLQADVAFRKVNRS